MNKNRHLFDKLIVVMTQSATKLDFTNFLRSNLEAEIIESYPYNGADWRHSAIQEALKHSTNDVLFLEQDFLFVDGFLEALIKRFERYPVIGFREGERFHPACLLVKRDVLDKTDKDFSVDTDVGDHFVKVSRQLENHDWSSLTDLPAHFHLAGTTQNYRLESNWYHPQNFFEYNKRSQELPQHDVWKGFCKQKEVQMGNIKLEDDLERYFV